MSQHGGGRRRGGRHTPPSRRKRRQPLVPVEHLDGGIKSPAVLTRFAREAFRFPAVDDKVELLYIANEVCQKVGRDLQVKTLTLTVLGRPSALAPLGQLAPCPHEDEDGDPIAGMVGPFPVYELADDRYPEIPERWLMLLVQSRSLGISAATVIDWDATEPAEPSRG